MTALTAIRREDLAPAFNQELNGILHLLTCGSVDDGKSTLIGRLLWDASDLYDDQRETINRSSNAATGGAHPDFSLLLDGLVAEREQGITIDIAWRYFDTETRRFVVIDSPGHEQYTRNMASGASHADVAIMLVDARHGVKRQTRRHAAILDIVGVKRLILAVNKMDLVDWSQDKFRAIEADFRELALRFGFREAIAIPVSAVGGDNVARKSEHMPWYAGPHLLEHLERIPSRDVTARGPFRMPVQTVLRDGLDFRGLAGTVSSGCICVGDRITDALSGQSAHVLRIATMDRDLEIAKQGQAVALQLDADIDVARGAVLSAADSLPTVAAQLEARIVWLWETPFDPNAGYFLRTATDLAPISTLSIRSLLDLETLAAQPSEKCAVNDIAIASITLGRPVAVDKFADNQPTGSFLIIDAVTGASVAGGVIARATAGDAANDSAFRLTRELLERGLCRDLGDSDDDRREFQRRASEAALLLHAAGIPVKIEL
ncbi:MAG: 50S ribosome-binding GTPase [Hyphomicrobium sp.]|uniref:GTP-binding protein n=1 Tax=Hyphomicrobium sp. TaxID=82 RepID=UPI00132338C0|nr:GTP-binding protein [Hyphomicrobium sp.]KAB2940521.1 MAG: sulfate adenylyltransferase [Hyphomicrobium sp.]MBZ0210879.1 50S ribosome-binding GTPase [Hyphomicrobium sp.]